TRGATIYDLPPEGVQIYLAASGKKMAELAGHVANGLITTSGKPVELYTTTILPAFEQGPQAAGRTSTRLDKMIGTQASFASQDSSLPPDRGRWSAAGRPPSAARSKCARLAARATTRRRSASSRGCPAPGEALPSRRDEPPLACPRHRCARKDPERHSGFVGC